MQRDRGSTDEVHCLSGSIMIRETFPKHTHPDLGDHSWPRSLYDPNALALPTPTADTADEEDFQNADSR